MLSSIFGANGLDLLALALVLTWLVLAPCLWLGLQVLVQNGRILRRLEALEQGAALASAPPDDQPASGLPVGSVLLDFELPLLTGGWDQFSAWRGKQLLLIFVAPGCPFSAVLVRQLHQLPAGEPFPLLVSSGPPEPNHQLLGPDAARLPVLLQEGFEVAVLAGAPATPAGYLVDRVGRTQSPLALGLAALLELTGLAPLDRSASAQPGQPDFTYHGGDPVFASYGAVRRGLPVGTPAPAIQLRRPTGEPLSLEAYRGQPLLLVFVEPSHAASQELLPELAELARRTPGAAVLVVSRGEPATNQAWLERYGGDLQIGLQHGWEASRAFDLVATPVAFLLDERGTISAEPAVGLDAVLALATGLRARLATLKTTA
jgi:peroxiredoxin